MRRKESSVGQQLPPLPAELDKVVSVGAVAVQEHDQPLGGGDLRIEARAGQFGGHLQGLQRSGDRLVYSEAARRATSDCIRRPVVVVERRRLWLA